MKNFIIFIIILLGIIGTFLGFLVEVREKQNRIHKLQWKYEALEDAYNTCLEQLIKTAKSKDVRFYNNTPFKSLENTVMFDCTFVIVSNSEEPVIEISGTNSYIGFCDFYVIPKGE